VILQLALRFMGKPDPGLAWFWGPLASTSESLDLVYPLSGHQQENRKRNSNRGVFIATSYCCLYTVLGSLYFGLDGEICVEIISHSILVRKQYPKNRQHQPRCLLATSLWVVLANKSLCSALFFSIPFRFWHGCVNTRFNIKPQCTVCFSFIRIIDMYFLLKCLFSLAWKCYDLLLL
jgi:hypothetical protein